MRLNTQTLASANQLVGEPAVTGIWLDTRPVPWYARYESVGSVFEFVLICIYSTFRFIIPKRKSPTEIAFEHSGLTCCVLTARRIAFIGAVKEKGGRKLTRIVKSFDLSELESCEYDFPRLQDVEFKFESGECNLLYFNGNENDLTQFATSIGK